MAAHYCTVFIFVIVIAKYCNEWTRVAVVRVRHGAPRLVASCLPLLQQVEQQPVTVRTLYTGATLSQCYIFIQVTVLHSSVFASV